MSRLIDAHHHFIDPTRTTDPRLTPDLAAIDRRFAPEGLAPELAATGIDETILVQRSGRATSTRRPIAFGRSVSWTMSGASCQASRPRPIRGHGASRRLAFRFPDGSELS